ncbi:MAG: hypothetical protein NT150_01525 [Bacteroidetes bacterium]|nr:hypothetical protein [Bacteroidota bacterium]
MIIIFGLNSFLLSKHSASELGISGDKDSYFERRQRYFHILLIPVFPCGKFWIIKKDGDLSQHEVPEEIKSRLNSSAPTHKTPLKSYSLLIIASVVFALLYFKSSYAENLRDEEITKNCRDKNTIIENAQPNTFLLFSDGNSFKVTVKILSVEANKLKCVVSEKQSRESETPEQCVDAFFKLADEELTLDTVLFSTETFRSCYNLEDGSTQEINFGKYKKQTLLAVHLIDIPMFSLAHTELTDGIYKAILVNKNVEATVLRILPMPHLADRNTIFWTDSIFPQKVNQGGLMYLQGSAHQSTNYVGSVAFLTKTNRLDSVFITITNNSFAISPVVE